MARNVVVGAIFSIALPLGALAAPAAAEYPDNTTVEVESVSTEEPTRVLNANVTVPDPPAPAPVSRTLPATGSDVVGIAAIGAALTAFGVVLVRRSRRQPLTVPAT